MSPDASPVRGPDDTSGEEKSMSTAVRADWVELARRASTGLEVALLWDRTSDRVKVVVSDELLCHHLDFEVARANVLDAFYHPFAHAAARLGPGAPCEE
jgi:hypothetical protein